MGKFDDIVLTPEDFGKTASTHTLLTGPELEALFGSEEERKAFRELLEVVAAATDENQKKTAFLKNGERFATVALKLLKKTVLGL